MNEFAAKYKFLIKDYKTQQLVSATADCVVIAETNKSYKIRLLTPIQRRLPDEELWVRKKNIYCRSYLTYGTRYCNMYNQEVGERSCAACLCNCLERNRH